MEFEGVKQLYEKLKLQFPEAEFELIPVKKYWE